MNTKLNKLLIKRNKNNEKIQSLTKENEKLDKQILELENTDIIGLVRSMNLTPEQLLQILKPQQMREQRHD